MGLKEQIMEQFLSELSGSSEHTRKVHAFYGGMFLDFAGDKPLSEWNKTLVNDFLSQLDGYAPSSVRLIYSIVKRVFDAAKTVYERERTRVISQVNPQDPGAVAQILKAVSLPPPVWDMGKRSAPKVESEDVVKPSATFEEMRAMIVAAKAGLLSAAEIAYLALSSIYGKRREELCRVEREHLDFGEGTIYVLTGKGGERRKQYLCEEISPYLLQYDFRARLSLYQMSSLYCRIATKAGVKLKEGSGWHSPRRYLDTSLIKLFGQLDAHIFLRWKISSSPLMTERYYSEDPIEIDRKILTGVVEHGELKKHPLVDLWR